MNNTNFVLKLLFGFLVCITAQKLNLEIVNNYSEFFNFGERKDFKLNKLSLENAIIKSKVDVLGEVFKQNILALKVQQELDLIFLIDASSSVGEENFRSEIRFVKKLLNDITVDYNHTRVAVITFSSADNVVIHVDEISKPSVENNKCLLLNKELNNVKYSGGGTYTLGAFEAAKDIFENSRNASRKILFLITDGFSNGGDPVPVANELKNIQVTVFTIGIQNGNYKELYELSSTPGEYHSFLLDSFQEFESLARRALHVDLKSGDYIPLGTNEPCEKLCEGGDCCDLNAVCACGTSTGHYSCVCEPGYYGSGLKNSCSSCPSGSYSDGPNLCFPCPDINHVTKPPAIGIKSCKCKVGFQATEDNQCEVLKCPKLTVPEHGYFVKRKECGNVLYSACGIRCEVGYTLSGSSIRLCQINGTWSGDDPSCQVKFCDKLQPPTYGSVSCKHSDLGVIYNESESQLPVDTVCTSACSKGRSLIGSRQRTCLPLARWDGLRTSCKQIKCNKLPQIKNGKIEPHSCTIGKQSYGRNCTFTCDEGYEVEGPKEISCTGQHGLWEPKLEENICVDKTPPVIKCPDDAKGVNLPGKKYGIVEWLEPEVSDNSGLDIFVWLKPSIKNVTEFKFQIGQTNLTYFAQDSANNRAKCKFSVYIEDKEPPTIEDCESPPIFLATDKTGAHVTWEEPNIFDNSQNVKISKSHDFGYFMIGITTVNYTATDPYNNTNYCLMNITVEDPECEVLPDPIFGQSYCATDKESLHCVITCQEGYALPIDAPTQIISVNSDNSATFICNNSDPIWYNLEGQAFPDCSVTEVPNGIEHSGLISLKPDTSDDLCNDSLKMREFENDVRTTLHNSLKYTCTASSCSLSTDAYCENDDELEEAEESTNIIKRDTHNILQKSNSRNEAKKRHRKKKRVNLTFNVKTDYKKIGMNTTAVQTNITSSFKNAAFLGINNESIKFSVVLDKPKIICPLGFVLKRNKCVQCPKGTFHNLQINRCQGCPLGFYNDVVGQMACKQCPIHHSTRKPNSKSPGNCKEECSPGTHARRKIVKYKKNLNITIERMTLKPHCRSCPLGTFQSQHGQTQCIKCPQNYTTLGSGSVNQTDCLPSADVLCKTEKNICNNGYCVPENNLYYSCNCFSSYIGSHCETKLNGCMSNPCLNDGKCSLTGNSIDDYQCVCKSGFVGKYCQNVFEKCELNCQNNGRCVQTEDNEYVCICPDGYGGDLCEEKLQYCRENTCENNGKCIENNVGFQCVCTEGYLGKRCNILPCDYKPCSGNFVCTNLPLVNATKYSYRCECLEGYRGKDCTEKIDFCENNPCLNSGKCIGRDVDYKCDCAKFFTGSRCEIVRDVHYVMKFTRSETTNFIKLKPFPGNLTEIAVCLWMKTLDTFNYGTLISYANAKYDNAFTLTDYTGLVLYVNNKYVVTDIFLNDGLWHHVCALWQSFGGEYSVYVDGILRQNGSNLASDYVIQGYGNTVIGQEQDVQGGKFSQSESFLGDITYLDIWSRKLKQNEVIGHMENCQNYNYGDLYAWPEIQDFIHGYVKIENSTFCGICEMPKPLYNGFIDIENNVAYYTCNIGYVLSEPSYLSGRKCRKTSEWEGKYEPYCKKIYCGNPGFIRNGRIIGRNFYYLDKVVYQCYADFKLLGNSTRICREDGKWFPDTPVCQGIQCTAFKKPLNSELTIIAEQSYEDFIEEYSKYDIGTQIEIKCPKDSKMVGESVITCQESGTWDYKPPQCIGEVPKPTQSPCTMDQLPLAPAHGYVDLEALNAVKNGTSNIIEYKCRIGYTLHGDNTSVCILDGYWTEPNTTCIPVVCPEPPEIKNMLVKHLNETENVYYFGNIVTYDCINGFRMYGSNVMRCLANGRWTKMQGKCTRKSCRKPVVSENTEIEGNSYLFEDSVTITCENGDSYILKCDEHAMWVGDRHESC